MMSKRSKFLYYVLTVVFIFLNSVRSTYDLDLNQPPPQSIDLNQPLSLSEDVEVVRPKTTEETSSKMKSESKAKPKSKMYRTKVIKDQSFARPRNQPERIMCTPTRVHHVGCPHWQRMTRLDKSRVYKQLSYDSQVGFI